MPTNRPTLYHNPRCSKSREALAFLKEKGFDPQIIEYLKTPPTDLELKNIVRLLGIPVRELLRKKEVEYKTHGLDNPNLTDDQIVKMIVKYPVLLERPIVVINKKAVIARSLEACLRVISG